TPKRAGVIALEVARTLQIAHDNGILHRDIKPANILVDQDRPYLTDFGIAKLRTHPSSHASETRGFIGTLAYASPEHEEGSRVDERSDVFSLGIVLFEMITRSRPFQGATDLQTFIQILDRDVESPSLAQFSPGISPRLNSIVARCLAKRPEDRYQSAGELADALAEYLGVSIEPLEAKPQAPLIAVDTAPEASSPLPATAWRVIAWAMATGALVLATVGLTTWWLQDESTASSETVSGVGTAHSINESVKRFVGPNVTDQECQDFAAQENPEVTQVVLDGCTNVTRRGLEALAQVPTLESISLIDLAMGSEKYSNEGVLNLQDLPSISWTCDLQIEQRAPKGVTAEKFSYDAVTGSLFDATNPIVLLQIHGREGAWMELLVNGHLHPEKTEGRTATENFLRAIAKYGNQVRDIHRLWLFKADLDPEAVQAVGKFDSLKHLRFDYSRLGNEAESESLLKSLNAPSNLEFVVLTSTGISDRDLSVASFGPALNRIDLTTGLGASSFPKNRVQGPGLVDLLRRHPSLSLVNLHLAESLQLSSLLPLADREEPLNLVIGTDTLPLVAELTPKDVVDVLWELAAGKGIEPPGGSLQVGPIDPAVVGRIPDQDLERMINEVLDPEGFSAARATLLASLDARVRSRLQAVLAEGNDSQKQYARMVMDFFDEPAETP
ncbi:MAG: serine/threonine-protein kinase, partial [Planctomycetota bacterium]